MNIFSRAKSLLYNRNPTGVVYKLWRQRGNQVYEWNGRMYKSEIIRTAIRPFVMAAGKLQPKHLRETRSQDGTETLKINPELYIKFLLNEPNPVMTGTKFREKMAWQYMLNGNAFAYLQRNENGLAVQMYPIAASSIEALFDEQQNLFLRFILDNSGKELTVPYEDVLHIPRDVGDNELFGSPNSQTINPLMNVLTATDQSIVDAIKNGGFITWLLQFTRSMRPEELKTRAQEFAKSFLNTENGDNVGVAATGADAKATQVEPHDYVPKHYYMTKRKKGSWLILEQMKRLLIRIITRISGMHILKR